MVDTSRGMKTYLGILAHARAEGEPIGSEYHLHNKHFRLWCKNKSYEETLTPAARIKMNKMKAKETKQLNKRGANFMRGDVKRNLSKEEIQEIVENIKKQEKSSPFKVVASGCVEKVRTSLDNAVDKTKNLKDITKDEKDKTLREKIKQIEKQKLVDSLTPDDRLAHIKSIGNGL